MKTDRLLNSAGVKERPLDQALKAQLVIVSDVHLQSMADTRGALLLSLIERLGRPIEYFVLNGDVFDFCFGGSAYFRRKFKDLGQALTALARTGTRVVFIEGNHEFHLQGMQWPEVEIVAQRDYAITLSSGERVKISHGDLLKNDPLYAAFRNVIKSPLATLLARSVPGSWLDAYAIRHARFSRAQDKYRRLDHNLILACFERWLDDELLNSDATTASGRFDHGVIGHFHVPYAEKRQRDAGSMLCVESWEQRPNLLAYGRGAWIRAYL